MRSSVPIPEEMPENRPYRNRGVSRRRAIELGAKAAAGASLGLTTTAWVKPQVTSVKLKPGCVGSPPPGRPGVDVKADARQRRRFGRQIAVTGNIRIRNVSGVQVILEKVDATVQYREGNRWKDAQTSLQLSGCGPGSCLDPRKSCSSDYSALATVPLPADTFRSRVEVKLMFRDEVFSEVADVEGSAGPPSEPPPEPPPSEPPPEPSPEPSPSPSEPPPEPSPSASPP
jgi:hypothetical protein